MNKKTGRHSRLNRENPERGCKLLPVFLFSNSDGTDKPRSQTVYLVEITLAEASTADKRD